MQSPLDYEFLRIPLPIDNRDDLSKSAKRFYGYICKHAKFADENGYIKLKNKSASKVLAVSERTIRKASNELSSYGLIIKSKIGVSNVYKLLSIDENGLPEIIPDYKRPKKKAPKINRGTGGSAKKGNRGFRVKGNRGFPNQSDTPIIYKESLKNYIKDAPAGHSFDYFFKKIRELGCYKIREQTLKRYWDIGYKKDLIRLADGLDKHDIDNRIKILQSTLNSFDKKEQMKNEEENIKQNEAHKRDIAVLAENGILENLFESIQ